MALFELGTNGKHSFVAQTTVCSWVAAAKEGRKKSSYSYFLMEGEDSFRVCKSFYWSKMMAYNFHQKKNKLTGILKPDSWGEHDKHAKVSDEQKNGVISHVDSIPVIESHYCRAKTNKNFFGSRD